MSDLLLSRDFIQEVCNFVRQGATPYTALKACGATFVDVSKYQNVTLYPQYDTIRFEITRASAFAKVKAEIIVFETKPEFWLTKGPARNCEAGEAIWADKLPDNKIKIKIQNNTMNQNATLVKIEHLTSEERKQLDATLAKLELCTDQIDTSEDQGL